MWPLTVEKFTKIRKCVISIKIDRKQQCTKSTLLKKLGDASTLTKDAASPLSHSLTELTATTQQASEMAATIDDSREDKEAFSDLEIGDSDEEILNKINPNENEEEGQLQVCFKNVLTPHFVLLLAQLL